MDREVFWLSSYIETALQRAVWYPTTIASLDYDLKKDIAHFYRISGADMGMLPFALHDFGGRGVTCAEQAEIGGAAHLVNFMGSDTVEGVRAANYYYSESMSAFSVPATEHSVECSFGSSNDEEEQYLEHVLNTFAKPGAIVSIVIDGYDVYRAAKSLCTTFKQKIIDSGAKVVFRPDSGDMMQVVPAILEMQAKAFGTITNSRGYKKINNVGLLQGDGIDRMAVKSLLGKILALGYSADNIVFGSGGALLQKVNRDTFKFAQKASAVLVPGVHGKYWKGIAKKPVTDPGKNSKDGRLTLVRSRLTGEYSTVDLDMPIDVEFEDVMVTVYEKGQVLNKTTLTEIRARCGV
jgi:nicotinamide phosphoribosyltransferase